MNTKQRRVILLGFVVILLMGMFPPITVTVRASREWTLDTHAGYGVLFLANPTVGNGGPEAVGFRANTSLLLCQWFLVSAVTGIIVMYSGDRRQTSTDKSDN